MAATSAAMKTPANRAEEAAGVVAAAADSAAMPEEAATAFLPPHQNYRFTPIF